MYRLHEGEVLTLSEWLIFEKCEKSLSESESTRRRHAMFEHLDEVPLWHHRFIISLGEKYLLCFEPSTLIEGIIELGESIPDFTSCDDRLESLDSTRVFR